MRKFVSTFQLEYQVAREVGGVKLSLNSITNLGKISLTVPLSNGISLTESNNVTEDFLVKSGIISITSDNIDEDFNKFNWFVLPSPPG